MPPKAPPKSAAAKAADKGDKSARTETSAKPNTPTGPQPYANDYTNKLKETLKKQLQATKGFPEKLKTVTDPSSENSRGSKGE